MTQEAARTFKLHGHEYTLIGDRIHRVIGYKGQKEARRMMISGVGRRTTVYEMSQAVYTNGHETEEIVE